MLLTGTLVLVVVFIAIGVPIAFAIGIAAWAYMLMADVPTIIFAQQVANGPDSWILLAMPLFVLAGGLMNETGISTRLIDFAEAMVGHLRGGLAMVNVVASMLFGGISGSSVADTAALGSVLIPGMVKEGYSKEISAAITSSSASIGIIVPPSIPMIIYGAIASVSVGTLFMAGIIPGILVGLTQMVVLHGLARRYGWGGTVSFSPRRLWQKGHRAVLGLFMPVIIIGGILGGVFTPTEAGAVAVVYGVVIAMVFYRSLSLRGLYRALVNAGILTAVVMIIVSTSFTFGWVMAHELVPQNVASWFASLSLSPTHFLIVVSILLVLLGCILHGDPLLLITVPVLLPAAKTLGIDPIHFGIVAVLCVALGQQTPPVGSTLFVVSAISGRNIFAIARANIPLVLTIVFVLTLVLFFPELVTWLPRRLGMM
jgi:C4-dicarboxylate transporter DctM subunit